LKSALSCAVLFRPAHLTFCDASAPLFAFSFAFRILRGCRTTASLWCHPLLFLPIATYYLHISEWGFKSAQLLKLKSLPLFGIIRSGWI